MLRDEILVALNIAHFDLEDANELWNLCGDREVREIVHIDINEFNKRLGELFEECDIDDVHIDDPDYVSHVIRLTQDCTYILESSVCFYFSFFVGLVFSAATSVLDGLYDELRERDRPKFIACEKKRRERLEARRSK